MKTDLELTRPLPHRLAFSWPWWQLWLTRRQAVVAFEDGLAREYREIAQRLPVAALLGEKIEDCRICTGAR